MELFYLNGAQFPAQVSNGGGEGKESDDPLNGSLEMSLFIFMSAALWLPLKMLFM